MGAAYFYHLSGQPVYEGRNKLYFYLLYMDDDIGMR